jgi:hypothetical protein
MTMIESSSSSSSSCGFLRIRNEVTVEGQAKETNKHQTTKKKENKKKRKNE